MLVRPIITSNQNVKDWVQTNAFLPLKRCNSLPIIIWEREREREREREGQVGPTSIKDKIDIKGCETE